MGSVSQSTDTRTMGSHAGDFAFLLHPHSLAPASLRHSLSLSFIFWKKGTLLAPTLRSRIETGRSDAGPARTPAPQRRSALTGLHWRPSPRARQVPWCPKTAEYLARHKAQLSRAASKPRTTTLVSPSPPADCARGGRCCQGHRQCPPSRVQGSDTALQPLGSR